MTKEAAMALLGEWVRAMEHAQQVLATEKTKKFGDVGIDSYRPEAMTWCYLAGWLDLDDDGASLLSRTKEAIAPRLNKSGGSDVPATCPHCGAHVGDFHQDGNRYEGNVCPGWSR